MNAILAALAQKALIDNDILFLAGPSAVGKSAAALEAARRFNCEIVSCDAMQVYREVNIASDKPAAEMIAAVKHHLLDVVSVEEDFNAARYRTLALLAIEDIRRRGRKVIVCGGSGMYMAALLDGIFAAVPIPEGLRESLLARARSSGLDAMHRWLTEIDPQAAARINPHDQVRIIRALEVFEATGMPISRLQKTRDGLWGKQPVAVVGLERPRAEMYARAEARIEAMFKAGLEDEVRGLLARKLAPAAARLIGIPEVKGYIDGEYGLDRAKYLMKLNTRHYIKRQMTWFRKDQRIEWVMNTG
ncbi:MAG: tRNA (adenosine(37)-N6)-dimethylallyltransferase MiaA [Candidatus Omnitrophica bacterium]|nr:tRNA (adenosine(37)-N6)-dimethylallyltransferase MiaA [Candidatus Omnitrophota bacterium]